MPCLTRQLRKISLVVIFYSNPRILRTSLIQLHIVEPFLGGIHNQLEELFRGRPQSEWTANASTFSKRLSQVDGIGIKCIKSGLCSRLSSFIFLCVDEDIHSCEYCLKHRPTKFLSLKSAEQLIHDLVTSRLDNNNALLFGLPDVLLAKLQRVQNTAARIITGTRRYDHITSVLHRLHWLPVKQRVACKVLMLTFKALHGLAPGYMADLILEYRPQHALCSASHSLLVIPTVKLSTYGQRTFSYAASTLRNALPIALREIDNLCQFKCNLKCYLFQSAY